MRRFIYSIWPYLLITAALGIHQLYFINRYAVNLMLWDQWEFYRPIFASANLWDLFNFQHGPHKQGLGGLIICALAKFSSWDSRWDAFAIGATLISATILSLLGIWKSGVRGLQLCIIPLIILNSRQYEGFVHASNVSHGALPVLLLVLLSVCWFIKSPLARYLCISYLTFALLFTGFGLFAGLLTPLILVVEAYHGFSSARQNIGRYAVGALILVSLSWWLFLYDYRFTPAVAEYRFPHERPWEYILFTSSMLSNFFGLAGHGVFSVLVGAGVAFYLAYLSVFYGLKIIRSPQDTGFDRTVFCLAAFTLIFCVQTAIGRTCLGWESASRASRYVTLMIPGGLAIFLHLTRIQPRLRIPWAMLTYGALLAIGTIQLKESDWALIKQWHDGRRIWKETYLATHDAQKAEEASHFTIYPGPLPAARLEFLEKHRFNLFKPTASP